MKLLFMLILILATAQTAMAGTVNYGWEDSDTVLGLYGTGTPPIIATISTDPVHGGLQSLCLEDNSPSSTPQAYIAWIVGLQDGDIIDGEFWRYDTTPTSAPHCRIWAHWNDNPDSLGYNGSAGGNSSYGPGLGWDLASHSWTVVDGHTGIVIEVRTYSSAGDIVWIDDMTITAPDHAIIRTPAQTPVQRNSWAQIKAGF